MTKFINDPKTQHYKTLLKIYLWTILIIFPSFWRLQTDKFHLIPAAWWSRFFRVPASLSLSTSLRVVAAKTTLRTYGSREPLKIRKRKDRVFHARNICFVKKKQESTNGTSESNRQLDDPEKKTQRSTSNFFCEDDGTKKKPERRLLKDFLRYNFQNFSSFSILSRIFRGCRLSFHSRHF